MKEASKRSQLVLVIALVLSAAGGYWWFNRPDPEAIGAQVAKMIQNSMDTTEPMAHLHMTVISVDVVHSDGNKYAGMAHINLNGDQHDVPVDITSDGDQVMMRIQPGGFMFIAPALVQPATAP
jgi:hypothetical protein